MALKRILIAGSTGNLGRALVETGIEQGYAIRAVARNPEPLRRFESSPSIEVVRAQVTRPEEVAGLCDGIDVVISALGVTRQRDRTTFRDVDYQANLNMLGEAKRAGVKKFVLTSGFGVDDALDNAMYRAKKDFELELVSSGMPYVIIRPSGFFSDMMMILDMAKRGRIYLFGPGTGRLNPIHLLDLAEYFFRHIDDSNAVLEVGGPETFSFNEIADMAFEELGRPPRVAHIPIALLQTFLPVLRVFSFNSYTEAKAFSRIMIEGAVAPQFGHRGLRAAFRDASGR